MRLELVFLVLLFLSNGLSIARKDGIPSILSRAAKPEGLSTGVPTAAPTQAGPGGAAAPVTAGPGGVVNVMDHGAKGDGKADDCQALLAAWKAVCESSGNPKMLIPKGSYLAGPLRFEGPCKAATTITIQLEGNLLGATDLDLYKSPDWIVFTTICGLTVTGGGTIDGQGTTAWPFNKCPQKKDCKLLPTSVLFHAMTDLHVIGIKSLNPKYFHYGVIDSNKVTMTGLTITAPDESPNTDGIHVARSNEITISDSNIGTGDDCISVGDGCNHVTVSGINCGPGHGISLGSLGKYKDEKDVTALHVRNCTITGTNNGVRIKTFQSSLSAPKATNITFEDIIMNNVTNPIIVDQTYCPYQSCDEKLNPSKVALTDIFFKNIRGTSALPMAVTLECSSGVPCKNVNLHDIDLTHVGGLKPNSTCLNVEAKFVGKQNPPPCM